MAEFKTPVAAPVVETPQPSVEDMAASLNTAVATPKAKKDKPIVEAKKAVEIDIENLTEADIFNIPELEARPLGYGDALNITIVNNNFSFRWVNNNERRYTQMRAQGWINAELKDVQVIAEAVREDGTIQVGDVILMKMPKLRYFQALKHNATRAMLLGDKKELDKKNLAIGNKTIAEVGGPQNEIRNKVSVYNIPDGA